MISSSLDGAGLVALALFTTSGLGRSAVDSFDVTDDLPQPNPTSSTITTIPSCHLNVGDAGGGTNIKENNRCFGDTDEFIAREARFATVLLPLVDMPVQQKCHARTHSKK